MDAFRTIINLDKSNFSMNHDHYIMLLGSCFAENIGEKLTNYKFITSTNPFGVLYNPASIKQSLELLLEGKLFNEKDMNLHNNLWFSYFHDTSFSETNKNKCLAGINDRLNAASLFLKTTNFLIITLGTAWVYRLKSSGAVVANCHKIPENQFTRKLLSVEEIVADLQEIINKLKNLHIIFTVSPVRHWKDGAVQNQVSKSTLLLAINKLVQANKNTSYFPAYEIMMDELRDYRFYAADMLHVNEVAINYIWEKFGEVFFDKNTHELIESIDKIRKARNHRLLLNELGETKKFAIGMLDKIKSLNKRNPGIDFSEETKYFESLS
jgi:hypothetical protein